MPKTTFHIPTAGERIIRAKAIGRELAQTSAKQWDLLLELSEHLSRLECIAPKKGSKLPYLRERIGRLRELLNTMELGAFSITNDNEMELLYQEQS